MVVSLFLQVFLFVVARWRRKSASWLLSTLLWLAYMSADSVAVFVLGHLAFRASEPGHNQLMSFWAPFVLVHLGGQDTITAFSIQDNQLWKRHLLNLVIQVVVAGYVVSKASWPDHRLKTAMVLIFISGFVKYVERIAYLSFATPEFLTSTVSWKLFGQGRNSYDSMRTNASKLMKKTLDRMSKDSSSILGLAGLMEAASLTTDIMGGDIPLNKVPCITLADKGKLPDMLKEFRSRAHHNRAYEHVGALLVYCYQRLYTKSYLRDAAVAALVAPFKACYDIRRCIKSPVRSSSNPKSSLPSMAHVYIFFEIIFYWLVTLFPNVAIPIALALFAAAEKGGPLAGTGTARADITVSYLLLVGAVVLDVCSVAIFIFSRICCSNLNFQPTWSENVGQYDMIKTAYKEYWPKYIVCEKQHKVSTNEFILDRLLAAGTRKEWSIASTRGHLALRKRALPALKDSVRSDDDFPTTVLIWHMATSICGNADNYDGLKKQMSIELSNYIMYLVFKCNVMLTPSSRVVHDNVRRAILQGIYRRIKNLGENDANLMELFSEVINKIEQDQAAGGSKEQEREEPRNIQVEDEECDEIKNLIDNHTKKLHQSAQVLYAPEALIRRARDVAQELIGIGDEAERWDLIAAVWAEMVYYTAPRCGAAFHYDHLSKGGEFITHVLVLMYLLGPFMPHPSA